MQELKKTGTVVLAGAGPGDPELITLKLQKRLAEADVIITDRLVHPDIIQKNVRKDAEVILAGKQGYNDASASQAAVTALMVQKALEGKRILRLKGGDVAFFSNMLDELYALKENNIPFEIIPGITAASGAAAYAGFPLTGRDFSRGVRFIAFNPNSDLGVDRCKELAATTDTLIFYMAVKKVIELSKLLLQYKKDPMTSLAVIEQATTVHQRIHVTSLEDCEDDFSTVSFTSPSLVIVGNVVQLHHQFSWFSANREGSAFAELR